MHPRFIKKPNFLKLPEGRNFDLKDWPQGVLKGLAELVERGVGIEEAVEYVERAFKERMGNEKRARKSWLNQGDVRDAVGLAEDDGFEKAEGKEVTVPVAGRNSEKLR